MRLLLLGWMAAALAGADRPGSPGISPVDEYLATANARAAFESGRTGSPGSLFTPGARLADLARDPRAYMVDDLVTILVSDRASAVARGTSSSQRKSSGSNSIAAAAGVLNPAGAAANLLNLGGESKLDGQGQTTRETTLTTTLSARVTHVLPNGYLVVEGVKEVAINSERQLVVVRGICRPQDLGPNNMIRSERLAQLELRVNGRGIVGDAVRRPNVLYRVLSGLLPF